MSVSAPCLSFVILLLCITSALPIGTVSPTTEPSTSALLSYKQEQQYEEDSDSDENLAGDWVRVLLLVTAAALQFKAPMLWSESRILRKLRSRTSSDIVDSIKSRDLQSAFAEIYIQFSKGRHRKFSRFYYDLYFIFVLATDVVSWTFEADYSISDAILALRFMIYFGAFTVLGARSLGFLEWLTILCFVSVKIGLTVATVYGQIRLTRVARPVLQSVVVSFLLMEFVLSLLQFVAGASNFRVEIADIAASIREAKFGTRKSQQQRFEKIQGFTNCENFDKKGTKEGAYWRLEWLDVGDLGAFLFSSMVVGLLYTSEYPRKSIPTMIAIETLEFVSTVLYFVNRTQVEPTLFVKIMSLAVQRTQDVGVAADGGWSPQ